MAVAPTNPGPSPTKTAREVPESHADADFLGPQLDDVAEHARQSNGCKSQGEYTEQGGNCAPIRDGAADRSMFSERGIAIVRTRLSILDGLPIQSTGIRVATQIPTPSNENPPPKLTVKFDSTGFDPKA